MDQATEDRLRAVVARRWRVGTALTALMMAIYFGFILLVAFDKADAGTLLLGARVSVGMVLGAVVIVLAVILTAVYVRWANVHYDAAIHALREHRGGDAP
ncbi:MAG: putative rane protein, clustering with ActP [Deltaproteobacteria bacterium]|nr:putative rane protein, clustering with ActP [Deltaproteobacteria bacterium]